MDIFLYNGDMARTSDLKFMEFVSAEQKSNELLLILVSLGGSPDAAYKIGRHLQARYSKIKIFVTSFCKSAGTLLAIAANEIIFAPYGELGPLDIQIAKSDVLTGFESGLNISEAFLVLDNRAKSTFHGLVQEIIANSEGVVSYHTASHSASEIVGALYGPIFRSIDPEEVGSVARKMRIGEAYGARLNEKYKNLKRNSLSRLSQFYPSHGFVIDLVEAQQLFNRARAAEESEKQLVEFLGTKCRVPRNQHDTIFENIGKLIETDTKEDTKNAEPE